MTSTTIISGTASETPAGKNRFESQYELVTFKVEDKVYKVPRHGFTWNSDVFNDMFTLPQAAESTEGKLDDNPIILPSCTKSEFEDLLEVLYPSPNFPPVDTTSKSSWISVLKLSTLWDMQKVRAFAIQKLSAMEIESVEKARLAKDYKVQSWLMEGYMDLVTTWGTGRMSLDDLASGLGWAVAARILAVAVRAKSSGTTEVAASTTQCQKYCQKDTTSTIVDHSSDRSRVARCKWCGRVVFSVIATVVECLQGEDLKAALKEQFKDDFDACTQ